MDVWDNVKISEMTFLEEYINTNYMKLKSVIADDDYDKESFSLCRLMNLSKE